MTPRIEDRLHIDELRKRFVLLASGEGRAETREIWALAMLAPHAAEVPRRVDAVVRNGTIDRAAARR